MESEPWIAFGLELQDLGPKGGSTLHCFQTLGVLVDAPMVGVGKSMNVKIWRYRT